MGMFDDIVGRCPHCGSQATSQTKLGKNLCLVIEPGSNYGIYLGIEGEPANFVLRCKGKCDHCGNPLDAKIVNHMFVGFVEEQPDYEESAWGNVEKI